MEKTKAELVADVEAMEAEVKKIKDEYRLKEFDLRKAVDKATSENAGLVKQVETLKGELNKLATLFDEYVVSFQDHIKVFTALNRNAQQVERYLQTKINAFNQGDKKE